MKHTKGPWTIKASSSGNHFIYSDAKSSSVAGVNFVSRDIGDEEALANEVITAAAPELLTALERVAEEIRLFMELHEDDEDAAAAYYMAIDAIVKAKGGN